jgi:CubicO group peptidase (beta-lactamase class C family)
MKRVMRIILKGLGWLFLVLVVVLALFAAFNWTMTRNMLMGRSKSNAETAQLYAQQPVKACALRALPRAASPSLSPDALAKMQAFSDQHKGLGLLVMQDGKLIYEHYAKGIGSETRTQTFSMNKSVTALMVGVALGDGTLQSIDAPLGDALPEWQGDGRKAITLRHLLTMASGLHNPSMAKGDWAALKLLLSDHIEATAIAAVADKPPGTEFRYKNGDAQLAGAVLRRAMARAHPGERYADYLSHTLWCGLGNGPATLWSESEEGAPRFYAGLQATLPDWARIGQMILDKGRVGDKQVVPADWIDQMTAASPTNPNYGFLIWRGSPGDGTRDYSPEAGMAAKHSAPYLAKDVIFFDGFGGQRVYIIPSAKLVIARTGETDMAFDDAPLVNLALAGLTIPPK